MVQIDTSVVKSYDIRGIYPSQLDERYAYLFGRALPRVVAAPRVAIGHDSRTSSPALYAALAAGLSDAGADVRLLGMCPTEYVYHALAGDCGLDAGVMVTASHNPPEYNGFKVVRTGGEPVTAETGLLDVCTLMGQMTVKLLSEVPVHAEPLEVEDDYFRFALDLVGPPQVQGLRVAVDAGNGVGGLLWDGLAQRLGVDTVRLNFEPDGRFPSHHPDPTVGENLRQLVVATVAQRADLGLAFDGDGDRVVAVLADGRVVGGSETIACLAERLVGGDPGIVFGVGQTVSRCALDRFAAAGLAPVMVPVGHSKIKTLMRADRRILFAGESAGHYYYRDFSCCDSSLITVLHLLHLVAEGRLAALVAALPGPWLRPEVEPTFRFDDRVRALDVCRRAALAAMKHHRGRQEITCEIDGRVLRDCTAEHVDAADGVRVDYRNWWFAVRPSGTEPIVRLTVEARKPRLLRDRTAAMCARIEQLS